MSVPSPRRIAVDTRGWMPTGRGIDRYTAALLRRWSALSDAELVVLGPRTGPIPPVAKRFEIRRVSAIRPILARMTRVGAVMAAMVDGCDVVFLPNVTVYPARPGAPLVVTAHDATPLAHPEFFTFGDRVWHWLVDVKSLMTGADRVLANSKQTRAELEALGVRPDRIRVIYHGIGEEYRVAPAERVRETLMKFRIPGRPYFLYLGAVEPRKNVAALIGGFVAARQQGLDATLVIAGPVRDPDEIADASDGVMVLGWIDDDDKVPLYTGACAVVSVARHEGFGMMPLEAFACGTRAILSPLPVYEETIGGNATYVDGDDKASIVRALINQQKSPWSFDSGEVTRLRSKFSWERCAAETLDAVLDAARSQHVGEAR